MNRILDSIRSIKQKLRAAFGIVLIIAVGGFAGGSSRCLPHRGKRTPGRQTDPASGAGGDGLENQVHHTAASMGFYLKGGGLRTGEFPGGTTVGWRQRWTVPRCLDRLNDPGSIQEFAAIAERCNSFPPMSRASSNSRRLGKEHAGDVAGRTDLNPRRLWKSCRRWVKCGASGREAQERGDHRSVCPGDGIARQFGMPAAGVDDAAIALGARIGVLGFTGPALPGARSSTACVAARLSRAALRENTELACSKTIQRWNSCGPLQPMTA